MNAEEEDRWGIIAQMAEKGIHHRSHIWFLFARHGSFSADRTSSNDVTVGAGTRTENKTTLHTTYVPNYCGVRHARPLVSCLFLSFST